MLARTVGPLLRGRTPADADTLRVLDPACGAGAFLLGAYRFLLAWRLSWYRRHAPERWPEAIERSAGGAWQFTYAERRRVLLASIYGVDLDPAAVVETARALAACACEGEPGGELLAALAGNIRCGNSLVGPDLSGDERSDPDGRDGSPARADAFDWAAAFPHVAQAGGFDAVIGNPPYLHLRRGALPADIKRYVRRRYATAAGQYDAFALFVERALALLAPGGVFGFILPRPLLASESYEPVRRALLHHRITIIADSGAPFPDAAVESAVVVAQRAVPRGNTVRMERVGGDGASVTLGAVQPSRAARRCEDERRPGAAPAADRRDRPADRRAGV
jgi:hypothetical protein